MSVPNTRNGKLGLVLALLGVLAVSGARADTMHAADSARIDRANSTAYSGDMYIGDGGNGWPVNWGVVSFQLPNLGAISNPFTAGTLSLTVTGTQWNNSWGWQWTPTTGLTSDGSPLTRTSGTVLGSDKDASGTDLNLSILYTDHTELGTYTSSGTQLVDFLNAAYAGGAGANRYVFVRIEAGGGLIWFKGFDVAGWNNGTEANRPQITYTATAAPSLGTVILLR